MHYKNNVDSLILTIPHIPKIISLLIILFTIVIVCLLQIKVDDYMDVFAIKYQSEDYIQIVVNYENTDDLFKYEYIEIDEQKYKINEIKLLTPNIEQVYDQPYNIISLKIDNYEDINEDMIIKIRLLKEKQSIFKKIFAIK